MEEQFEKLLSETQNMILRISFFLHSVSANLMIAKKRGNARKTPEIVRFRGFEAMISFLASQYE